MNFTAMRHRIMLLGLCVYSLRRIRANLLSNVSMSANDTLEGRDVVCVHK